MAENDKAPEDVKQESTEQNQKSKGKAKEPAPAAEPAPELAKVEAVAEQPKAELPKPAHSVKVLHDFPLMAGNQCVTYKKDQILSDPLLVRYMLENNCPVVPVEQNVDFHVCPKCYHQF